MENRDRLVFLVIFLPKVGLKDVFESPFLGVVSVFCAFFHAQPDVCCELQKFKSHDRRVTLLMGVSDWSFPLLMHFLKKDSLDPLIHQEV